MKAPWPSAPPTRWTPPALGLMTLETGAESAWRCTPWQARAATAAPGWPRYAQGKPAQSAQWLFGAGVYLARQADLPLPELSSPDAAEQLWQTLTVAGDPTYLPQQADPLRLQCPPAPVAAGSKPPPRSITPGASPITAPLST